jgi:hypothetical protein
MAPSVRRLRPAIPIGLAALALSHPTWSGGDVAMAVATAGGWWLPLHVLLIAGYAALVRLLWVANGFARVMLIAFLACNTAYVAVDGVAVGPLAGSDPLAADLLWNSPLIILLADLTGATWSAALLCVAAAHIRGTRSKPLVASIVLTWVAFVASAPPLSAPPVISRVLAAATGAWLVYSGGPARVPAALLVFAAVLHQHVGAEAALGLVLVSVALTRLPEPG